MLNAMVTVFLFAISAGAIPVTSNSVRGRDTVGHRDESQDIAGSGTRRGKRDVFGRSLHETLRGEGILDRRDLKIGEEPHQPILGSVRQPRIYVRDVYATAGSDDRMNTTLARSDIQERLGSLGIL
jgi:hypothetical protein